MADEAMRLGARSERMGMGSGRGVFEAAFFGIGVHHGALFSTCDRRAA